ncbi:hypothetical protein M0R45_008848 [Rubus argutus]|uniref:Uncharacterized protein n=1 Tax=Rubus argutus TaxID=59490 RepID=A0AAW1Y3A0_RUBAR
MSPAVPLAVAAAHRCRHEPKPVSIPAQPLRRRRLADLPAPPSRRRRKLWRRRRNPSLFCRQFQSLAVVSSSAAINFSNKNEMKQS